MCTFTGYGNIDNSIAIEFDTHRNRVLSINDPSYTHISIRSCGMNINDPTNEKCNLSGNIYANISMNTIHTARIVLFPTLKTEFIQNGKMVATAATR